MSTALDRPHCAGAPGRLRRAGSPIVVERTAQARCDRSLCSRGACPPRATRTGSTRTCGRSSERGSRPPATRRSGAVDAAAAAATHRWVRALHVCRWRFRARAVQPARCNRGVSVSASRSGSPVRHHAVPRIADERFALLNEAFATDGASSWSPPRTRIAPACVELLFVATEEAQTAASYPRLELAVQAQRRASASSSGTSACRKRRQLRERRGQGRRRRAARSVDHYRVQQVGRARHLDRHARPPRVAQDARLRSCTSINLGAGSARSTMHVAAEWRARRAQPCTRHRVARPAAGARRLCAGRARRARYTYRDRAFAASPPAARASPSTARLSCAKARSGADSHQTLRGLLAGTGRRNRRAPAARDLHRRRPLRSRRHGRQARRQHAVLSALPRHRSRHGAAAAEVGVPRRRGLAHRRPRAAASRSNRVSPAR